MKIKIGTRASKLAIAQTNMVKNAINAAFPQIDIQIVLITTKGDKILDKPLEMVGGKGVFVGEIESALLSGEIDAAVHSGKDLPVVLGEGLEISGVLEAGDYRDVLISPKGKSYTHNDKFTVGTGSARRKYFFSKLYPNAEFLNIRGNIDTRLAKLLHGEYDSIVLCSAGLKRIGISLDEFETKYFDFTEVLPSPCQGIIAIESVKSSPAAKIIKAISHHDTQLCFNAQRQIVSYLGADCTVPIGAYSYIENGMMHIFIDNCMNKQVGGECSADDYDILVKELTDKL